MASTVRAIYKDVTGKGITPVVQAEGLDTPPSDDYKGKEKIRSNVE
jgi:hypothetical protein